jgi:pimeloyl-ACP methyl ester carboxylesterase
LSAKDESQHLETDHPRPAIRTWAGATLKEVLPEDLTTSLKLLSQRERVSLFMTLLAAFQCVLHRNSGETDIAVGSCAANRSLTTAEGVVGRFANDLVIRTDFSGCQTFRELLNRVRTQALTAFSNQDLPFAKLTDELKPRTPIGCNPLFQVMFILQDAPKGELSCPGLRVDRLAFDMGTAKYDLCVLLSLQQGVEIAFEYNTALFERATIEQLFDQFKAILRGMVGDPSGLISDGKCTTQALRPTLVAGDNDLHSPSPIEDSVLSKLVDIWETGFHKRPIGTDDDFFELGGDSLLAAGLFAQINKAFDVTIPIVNLIEAPTIRKLATIVRSSRLPREMRCAVLLQNGGSRPPLFCIHGQSGNLLVYREFAKYLGHDQPVYGLQPLGLDGRHRPLTRIEDMASTYLQEMQLIQPREPYFLAGYCMGGLIALEMATQLLGKGLSVGLLALIDTYNVGLMKSTRIDDVAFAFQKCWFGWNHFLRMDTKYRLTYLKRRFGELGNEPSEVSDANEVAALSYVPAPYPGKLLHIYPSHQYSRYKRSELAWNGLAGGGVEELALPIYPGQMFEEASACKLAAKVNSYIGASCCGVNETRRPIAVPCCW